MSTADTDRGSVSADPRAVTVTCVGLGAPGRAGARVVAADWPEVLGAYQRAVTRIVSEYGGTPVELDGDRVVATFGCGRPADSGGTDALAAALDLVRAVDRLSANLPPRSGAADLRARVGVHTGIPAHGAGPAEALAELVDAAGRLRAGAGPGEVLAGELTARHAGTRFELVEVDLGSSEAGAGIAAHRVVRARPARSRPERRSPPAFVGREAELAWLDRHWAEAATGPARAVLVVGEPGVGKSRLVTEFASRVAAAGARVVSLACQRTSALNALHPFGPVMGTVPHAPEAASA